jgi:hypothetical protein
MVVRRFDVAEKDMPEVGTRSRKLIEESHTSIVWEHSHVVVGEDGKVITYCVYEAPSAEIVREHAEADARGPGAERGEVHDLAAPASGIPAPARRAGLEGIGVHEEVVAVAAGRSQRNPIAAHQALDARAVVCERGVLGFEIVAVVEAQGGAGSEARDWR